MRIIEFEVQINFVSKAIHCFLDFRKFQLLFTNETCAQFLNIKYLYIKIDIVHL